MRFSCNLRKECNNEEFFNFTVYARHPGGEYRKSGSNIVYI